jgi:hypothetical protein
MARTKKTKKTKATKLRAKKATIRSTGGVGFNFEDQAAAWLLVKMLRGEALPGINTTGDQLQMQTRSLGWDIDDLLASGAAAAASSGRAQVAVSCKSNVQVTSSGLPSDFVSAAWQQWRKTEPMHRVSDCLALVTRGRNATFDAIWSDIKTWCADSNATFAMAKINASEKHKKVFASVKETDASTGASVTDEDTVALMRHLHVISLDFQLVPSETEQDAIARCREILSSGTLEDARKLWQALVQRAENGQLSP